MSTIKARIIEYWGTHQVQSIKMNVESRETYDLFRSCFLNWFYFLKVFLRTIFEITKNSKNVFSENSLCSFKFNVFCVGFEQKHVFHVFLFSLFFL